MKNKTIFLYVNQQFHIRYILQTNIYKKLSTNAKVIIISPNSFNEDFIEKYELPGVIFEQLKFREIKTYLSKRIIRFFSNTRRFIYYSDINVQTIDLKEEFLNYQLRQYSFIGRLVKKRYLFFAKIIRKYDYLIDFFKKLELLFNHSSFHKNLYQKYKPDLLITADLGTIEVTNNLIIEANQNQVKVLAIILSWDNTTTKGIGTIKPDYVIAWNNRMKYELMQFHKIEKEKIYIGGIAHYDSYFNFNSSNISNEDILSKKRKIFFGLGSPSWFKESVSITEKILYAIDEGTIKNVDELIVRVHPVHVIHEERDDTIQKLYEIQKKYPNVLKVMKPKMKKLDVGYDFSESDLNDLISCISNSDVLITQYSTLFLEGAILNKPIVNIGFDKLDKIDLTSYEACRRLTHIDWISPYNFTKTAINHSDMIRIIKNYLDNPNLDSDNRSKVRDEVCSENRGFSGDMIGEFILKLDIS